MHKERNWKFSGNEKSTHKWLEQGLGRSLPVRDLIILVTFPPISTPYAGLGDLAIEAFARTLQVHKRALNRQEEKNVQTSQNYALLVESPSADDDRAELPEAEIESEKNAQMSAATAASSGSISWTFGKK